MVCLRNMFWTILLGFMISGLPAWADSPIDSLSNHPLSLRECIQYALEHHGGVLAAERDVTASRADLRLARTGYLPVLTLSSQYSRSGYEGEQVGTGFTRVGTFTSDQIVLGISETFFDGGRTKLAIRQASAAEESAFADLELEKDKCVLKVTEAYFGVLLAQRLAVIASQTVEQAEKQRALIQARIDAGQAAPVDIYPVEVQLANAKLQKLQADNDVRIAANTLRNAMGLKTGPALLVSDVGEVVPVIPSLEDCLKSALENRPEVIKARAQLKSAQAALAYAKSQFLPVSAASFNYDRGLGGSGFDTQWSIGVNVSLNIFDCGATRAKFVSSKERTDAMALRAEQVANDISTEVQEAYFNLTSAIERLASSKVNVELAKTNFEVASAKYEQGLGIPLEIVAAQISYANAQASEAKALYDCYIARAKLDKAIGKRGYYSEVQVSS